MQVNQFALVEMALEAAARHGLDGPVVCAVCEEESGRRDGGGGRETWNPWAMRFEPAFESRYVKPAIPTMPTTEEMAEAVSFGLMQIMGETAREFGFKGRYLTELCDPATGLEYGCRKLRRCFDNAAGDVGAALLHWNGGSDPAYPSRVVARVGEYQA